MLTCKRFNALGAEFLFHSLFFDSPAKMFTLCADIEAHSSLGWWTKRLHITRFYASDGPGNSAAELQSNLAKLLLHLPNLDTFIIDWSLGDAFGPVTDALMSTCRKSLKTLSIRVPSEALAKVIWTLTALPNLMAVHIEFDSLALESVDEDLHLGAANNIHFALAKLQQLSLKGHLLEFLEQAIGWSFPVLTSLSLYSFEQLNEHVTTFLKTQGEALLFLDAFCPQTPSLDVPTILELCPSLRTLGFNADWRPANGQNDNSGSNVSRFNSIANSPHSHITTIGLHGLQYAFGAASLNLSSNPLDIDPLDIASVNAHLTLRANENNFSALTKRWFPRLERVRILDRSVLRYLHESELNRETDYSGRLNDIERVGVAERYDSWCSRCYEIGVRLEDCTGGLLGVLPADEEDSENEGDDSEGSDESGDEYSDEYSDEDGIWMYPDEDVGEHTTELRRLIEECRQMERSRGDLVYIPPDIAQVMMDGEDEEFRMPMIMVTGPGS